MPLRKWLAEDGYVQRIALKFMLEDDDPPYIKGAKLGVLMAAAFVLGGAMLWLTMGYIFSWAVLRMFFLCAKVVIYSKSRYYPGHEFDEVRRHAITRIPINNDSHYVEYPNALFLVKAGVGAFLYGLVLFARWVFDLLLIRSIFFIMGFGDNRISNSDILKQMPKVNIKIIDETILQLIMLLAQLLAFWPYTYRELLMFLFNGIPRCKGPSVLFATMIFFAIYLVLIKFLNYDYFSLYAA
jgi:hypothetical protein